MPTIKATKTAAPQPTIPSAIVAQVHDALAKIPLAESEAERRSSLCETERGLRDAAEQELAQLLKNLVPTDDQAVIRCATLKLKLEIWPDRLRGLEAEVFRGRDLVKAARDAVLAGLAAAACEIRDARKKALQVAVESLEDGHFAAWCSAQGPRVVEAERFAANPNLAAQRDLSLEQLAEIVLAGGIPKLPPPPDLRAQAGFVAWSNAPMPNY